MSDSPLPDSVDPRKIFTQQGVVEGQLALSRLPRLQELLASEQGSATASLQFRSDDYGRKLITGKVAASVQVICQRCLEVMALELSDDVHLALVSSEAAMKTLDAALDPWLCTDNRIDLTSLVDEQLVLSMPIVNLHTTGRCAENRAKGLQFGTEDLAHESDIKTRNPFAVLETLKKSE